MKKTPNSGLKKEFKILDNVDLEDYLFMVNPMKKYMIEKTFEFGSEQQTVLSHYFGPYHRFLDSKVFSNDFVFGNADLKLALLSDQRRANKVKDCMHEDTGYWERK